MCQVIVVLLAKHKPCLSELRTPEERSGVRKFLSLLLAPAAYVDIQTCLFTKDLPNTPDKKHPILTPENPTTEHWDEIDAHSNPLQKPKGPGR